MSNIFFIYDTNGNITQASTSYPNTVTPPAQLLVADDTTPNAQAALGQPQNYMIQNGEVVPAVTLTVGRTHAVNGRWDQYQLSVSASDGGAHSVTLDIGGNSQAITTPATVNVNLHGSLSGSHIAVTSSGTGIVTNETFIGGNNSAPSFQHYTDANGLLHIAPTQKQYLVGYYTQQVSPATAFADTATALGLLLKVVFGDILPQLKALKATDSTGTLVPIVTLTANQQNALNDLTNKILNGVQTTLENAAPVPAAGAAQAYDLHYASFENHWSTMATSMQNYVDDVNELPNLV